MNTTVSGIVAILRQALGLAPSHTKATKLFTKAIAQLDGAVAIENRLIEAHDAQIERAAKLRLDAFTRRDRAQLTSTRIEALVA